jgi:hypothetical protein
VQGFQAILNDDPKSLLDKMTGKGGEEKVDAT